MLRIVRFGKKTRAVNVQIRVKGPYYEKDHNVNLLNLVRRSGQTDWLRTT